MSNSNFDVRLLPLDDIYASAPTDTLVGWHQMLSSEINQRHAELGASMSDWDYSVQYALIGEEGVGKSNLMLMFNENVFRVSSPKTKTVEFSRKMVTIDNLKVKLQIWDTAWGDYTGSYISGAAVVFFVYNVTELNSFQSVCDFILKNSTILNKTPVKVLIGNKIDLNDREVSRDVAHKFAMDHGLNFVETSAKTGEGVTDVFMNAAHQCLLNVRMGSPITGGIRHSSSKKTDVKQVKAAGVDLIRNAVLNKGEAFTISERDELNLHGLLPPKVLDIDTQAARCYEQFARKSNDVEKYIYLESLHDRNETLYYKLLLTHIQEMLPIVYTPVVGKACQLFGYLYRAARGMYFTSSSKGSFQELVWNCPNDNVDIIVVTDGSRILGLGDLGANGMGIPIGKLALYVACAGVAPGNTLPCMIDIGTNNKTLLEDELYLGERRNRIDGQEYYAIIDEFVGAVKSRWPDVLIQFEDFTNDHAFPILSHYQHKTLCFNDDIQGTGSVALAGLLAAIRQLGSRLVDQRIVFLGAGSAAIGIADMIVTGMIEEGMDEETAKSKFWFVDSQGLVTTKRPGKLQEHKIPYARNDEPIKNFADVIDAARPTVLMGLSGQAGSFTKEIIQKMCTYSPRPIIFALSNPTSLCECTAQEAYEYTDGECIFASGSPFDPVEYNNKRYIPGQGNNMYIFPGVGLAAIIGKFKYIPNSMFYIAARTLSSLVTETDLLNGTMYPHISRTRELSSKIAQACMKFAFEKGIARIQAPENLETYVDSRMWQPKYKHYELHPAIRDANGNIQHNISQSNLQSHMNKIPSMQNIRM